MTIFLSFEVQPERKSRHFSICARQSLLKLCAVGMRNAILGNELNGRLETRKMNKHGTEFSTVRTNRNKRTTSKHSPQFSDRFFWKSIVPSHLLSNRNFRDFWLNGKHPSCPLRRRHDCAMHKTSGSIYRLESLC